MKTFWAVFCKYLKISKTCSFFGISEGWKKAPNCIPSTATTYLNGKHEFYRQSNNYRGQDLTLDECLSICNQSDGANIPDEQACAAVLYDPDMNGTNCYFYTASDYLQETKVPCQRNELGQRLETYYTRNNTRITRTGK